MEKTIKSSAIALNEANATLLADVLNYPLYKNIKVEQLFQDLLDRPTNNTPRFVVMNGQKCTSKTFFCAHFLQEFCLQNGIISRKIDRIEKLSYHLLKLKIGSQKQDIICQSFEAAKGNILVLADFEEGAFETTLLINKIKSIIHCIDYANTVIVLSGEYKKNGAILFYNKWFQLFSARLDFWLSPSQMTYLFESYLFDNTFKLLTEDAKKALWYYFKKQYNNRGFDFHKDLYTITQTIKIIYPNQLTIDAAAIRKLGFYKRIS